MANYVCPVCEEEFEVADLPIQGDELPHEADQRLCRTLTCPSCDHSFMITATEAL